MQQKKSLTCRNKLAAEEKYLEIYLWKWKAAVLLRHKNTNCLYDSNIYPLSEIKTGFREEINQPDTSLSLTSTDRLGTVW